MSQVDFLGLRQALGLAPELDHSAGSRKPASCAASLPHILDQLSKGNLLDRLQPPASAATYAASFTPHGRAKLADLLAYGDGGSVCDRLTSPLFHFMAHEVRSCRKIEKQNKINKCFSLLSFFLSGGQTHPSKLLGLEVIVKQAGSCSWGARIPSLKINVYRNVEMLDHVKL